MTLRSRLTIAFFAISVIPLSAVTLFSYYSSERALRRAAEQQAASMAAELGRRMEWVTSDLERRMDRVWPMPPEQTAQNQPGSQPDAPRGPGAAGPAPQPPSPDMAGHLAVVLGDVAPMIESLEIMAGPRRAPAPPPPPAAEGRGGPGSRRGAPRPRPPGPPVPPQAAGSPSEADISRQPPSGGALTAAAGSHAPEGYVPVEMQRVIDKAMEAYRSGSIPGQVDFAEWSRSMQARIREGAGTAGDVQRLRQQARAIEGEVARLKAEAAKAQADRLKSVTEMKGADVNSSVLRDGEEVGRIHARLNLPRIFRAIMPPGSRQQGEVGFLVDAGGEIHARDADKPTLLTLKNAGAIPREGATVRSEGDWVVVTRKGPGDITFGTARPLGNDLRELRSVALRNFVLGFGLITLVFVASVPLAGGMTRNLRTLMQGVQKVAHGDLNTRVPVRSTDEFGRLAAAFNQMAADLAEHEKLVVQQERLQRELELCRQIQNEMLPREPLRVGLAEVKGVSIPAREVGGDFFNYFVLPSGEIAVLVGDVSGKGVGAALLMANVQATLRARLPLEQDLATLASLLDTELHASTPPEVYLTLFVGIVNPRTRVLRYVNAGHNTQFILRRNAGIERMPSAGRPLGLLPGGGYEERATELPVGDLLFFYTDGIVEVENESGEMFNDARLEAVLLDRQTWATGVDDVLARVEAAVRDFRGKAEPLDDATMMALRLGE